MHQKATRHKGNEATRKAPLDLTGLVGDADILQEIKKEETPFEGISSCRQPVLPVDNYLITKTNASHRGIRVLQTGWLHQSW